MLLGLLATGFHLFVIVVSGRAAALCARLSSIYGQSPYHDKLSVVLGDADKVFVEGIKGIRFIRYVKYCDRLHLIGALMILASFLTLSFSLFMDWKYPMFLLIVSLGGGFSVYNTGFWKVSIVKETIEKVKSCRGSKKADSAKSYV